MANKKPEPKNNEKSVEEEVNRLMAKHEEHAKQPVTDEDIEHMKQGWRDQYGYPG